MESEIKLWVCPNCHILQGIEIWEEEELRARCVNCGVPLPLTDVAFIDPVLAKTVIDKVQELVPEEFHDFIRYHWLSNQTVGIVFEVNKSELQSYFQEDIVSYFEEVLEDELGLTMTLFFEN